MDRINNKSLLKVNVFDIQEIIPIKRHVTERFKN